jgi:hypothetical protein
MDNTPFSKKCEILGRLHIFYGDTDNAGWKDFFAWSDLGLPMAWMASSGLVTVKTEGKQYVNDAWDMFCTLINIDANAKYESLEDCFAASPNPPLDEDEG